MRAAHSRFCRTRAQITFCLVTRGAFRSESSFPQALWFATNYRDLTFRWLFTLACTVPIIRTHAKRNP